MDRRAFLREAVRFGIGAGMAHFLWGLLCGRADAAGPRGGPRAAEHWHALRDGAVQCDLCPRREVLRPGAFGACRVRQNRGGRLVTHGYDQPCVLNIDPIEKNPLAHVLPGAALLSVAHAGCNLRCLYCQNWQFSQKKPTETENIQGFDQARSVAKAVQRKLRGIVFTYTEPAARPEFVGKMAALARGRGLVPTLCTCGFVEERPFRELLRPFAAVTITYKGPTDEFYRRVCRARLKPVLDAMLRVKAENKWLEIATLVVPTLNDDDRSLRTIARWMVRNLGADTPWHIERFTPMYKLTKLPPTPQRTLERARKIGQDAGLRYVYISNLAPHEGNHTYCPKCGRAVIKRLGFKILRNDLRAGRCPHCGREIAGVWR